MIKMFVKAIPLFFVVFANVFALNDYEQLQKIAASDRASSDYFGCAVSISGSYAIVGAYQESHDATGGNLATNAGAAYIYKRTGSSWTQIKKLVASDRAAGDYFGYSVSISDSIAVVGAPNNSAVYIYSKNQGGSDAWGQVQFAQAGATSDQLGWNVAVFGNNAIAGTFVSSTANGYALVFNKDQGGVGSWGIVKVLTASDGEVGDRFGTNVAISDSVVVVGAEQEDHDINGINYMSSAGSAYIYAKNQGGSSNWGQVKKIVASTRVANDNFGHCVSVSGDNSFISGYLFSKNQGGTSNWGQVKKLYSVGVSSCKSASIFGDYLIVGLFQGTGAGDAAVHYKDQGGASNWGLTRILTASDSANGDRFGYGVSICNDYAIVGAEWEDHDASGGNTASYAGSAYMFGPIATPSTQASNITYANIQPNQMSINWTKGDGARRLVFVKQATTGTTTPVNNTTYTANTTFGSGTQIGSTGWYCVYNDTGTIVALNGITAGTSYIVQVFEYNGSAGWEKYITSSATNNPLAQTSMYAEPTTQASNIAGNRYLNGVTKTTLTVDWTRGNGVTGVAVFMAAASSGSASPVDGSTYTANSVFGSGTQIGTSGWFCVYKGTGTLVVVTGLSAETNYRMMACEYNGTSILTNFKSDDGTNNPATQQTMFNEPTIQATNITITNVTTTGFTTSWTRGNGSSVAVLIAQASSGSAPAVDGSDYTANPTFGNGTQFGTPAWFCVYSGTGTSVQITGLSAATTYRVMAIEFNGSYLTSNYLTSTGTGNPANQTTLATQTITFVLGSDSLKTYGEGTIALSGSASSSLTVLYTSSNTAVATVSGSTVTIAGAGSTTITATQAGNSTYAAASDVQRTLTVSPKGLTISGLSGVNKTYNGNTTASLSGTALLNGIVSGDESNVAINASGMSATFANSTVATSKTITVTGYALSGSVAGNYSLTQPTGLTANITVAPLTITGLTGVNRVYNRTVTATLTGTATLSGVISGDASNVSVSGTPSAVFASDSVGTGKAITVIGYTLSGSAAGNYSLTQPTGLTANITAQPLTITGLSAAAKTYDGSATATLSGTPTLSGIVSGDESNVSVTGTGSAVFSTATVGTGKTVTVSGYSLSGSAAGNYSLTQPTGLTANITAKGLTISGVTASSKTYDGLTTATLSGGSLVGVIGSETVTITAGSGTFADKNVGTGKTVTATGYSISGADAGNYTLSAQPSGITGNITSKALTITADNKSKSYGASDPVLTVAYSGFVSGENSSVLSGTLAISRATGENAGTYAITPSGFSSTNYAITFVAGTFTITGSVAQTITFGAIAGKTYGDAVFTLGATASSSLPVSYASSNTGVATLSNDTVTIIGAGSTTITASQSGNSNYAAATPVQQTLSVAQKPVSISGVTASSKTYDGLATATLSGGSLVGVVGTDVVTITAGTGTFANKDVGNGKTVTATGYALSGANAANYSLSAQPSVTAANITAKTLTITADNKSKNFGAGDPALTVTYSGFVSEENSSVLSGTLAISRVTGENAGTYAITPSGLTATNYALTFTNGVFTIVGGVAQTITFNALTGKTNGDAPFVLTATASSGLAVSYTSSNTLVATISGNTVTVVGAGSTTITAAQTGDVNYLAATNVAQTLTVVPAAPTISSSFGGSIISVTPQLIWKKSLGAVTYRVQISKTAVFDTIPRDSSGITDTSYEAPALSNDTKYFWRTLAVGSAGNSTWSAIDSFKTIVALPQRIMKTSILTPDTIHTDSLVVKWNAAKTPKADRYWIEVARDTAGSPVAYYDSSVTDTNFILRALKAGGYKIQVRAHNAAGWGVAGESKQLVIITNATAVLPTSFSLKSFAFGMHSGTLSYDLPVSAMVTLKIYNLKGACVRTVIDCMQPAGRYTLTSAIGSIGSGSYIYCFKAGKFEVRNKFSITR